MTTTQPEGTGDFETEFRHYRRQETQRIGRTKHMKCNGAKFIGCLIVLQVAAVVQSGSRAQVRTKPSHSTGADTPPYQELRCRGGAGLRFAVVDEGRKNSTGEQMMYMRIDFQPAAQPADPSGRNLQPGQCAFPERVVRTNEPNQIVQEIVDFAQLKRQLHGAVDTSPTAAEKYPDAQNVPKYLSDAKHYWIFFVRQTRPLPQGQFQASNGRAWKPGKENEVVIPNSNRNKDRERVLKPGPQ
jgi:hypothetical protein